MIEVSPDELLTMLGMKEAELLKLRMRLAQLEAQIAQHTCKPEEGVERDGNPVDDHR